MKYCKKCKTWKDKSEFHKHKLHKDGLASNCKICANNRIAEYQKSEQGIRIRKKAQAKYKRSEKGKRSARQYIQKPNIKERYRKYARVYRASEHGRAKLTEYKSSEKGKNSYKRYRESYPLKEKAKRAVNNAVQSGLLPHISTRRCIKCNKRQAEHYHHWSYEPKYWLDVIPLCIQCHSDIHREMTQ